MQSLKDFSYRGLGEREFYAKKAYPDPPRPREIIVKGFSLRSVNGELQTRSGSSSWAPSFYSAEEIRAMYDLLERPNA